MDTHKRNAGGFASGARSLTTPEEETVEKINKTQKKKNKKKKKGAKKAAMPTLVDEEESEDDDSDSEEPSPVKPQVRTVARPELAGGGANSFIKASVTPQSMAERTRHRRSNSSSISTSLRFSL